MHRVWSVWYADVYGSHILIRLFKRQKDAVAYKREIEESFDEIWIQQLNVE